MRRRKEKQSAKFEDEEDLEDDKRASSSVVVSSSDEEANEDLTLKIEEKAQRRREVKLLDNGGVLDGDGGCGGNAGLESAELEMKINEKNVKKIESGDQSVITAEEQETSEAIKAGKTNESPEASAVQMSDNIVLRKLLRGPRYFDPPDSNWGACFNCGEGGHTAVNCKAGKRKKPCFVCGSFEHAAKQCNKARDCFICKKGGHQAKDCPEKTTGGGRSAGLCLKCGDSGHDMFQCKNSYSSDDLKEIQCYVCKEFGHLCCVDSNDGPKWEVSCYKCGQLGHHGLACTRLREETTGAATPSLCFKCGEAGHFARECTSSGKGLLEETTGAATPSSCFKCGEAGHFARECTSSGKGLLEETTGAATPSSCFKCGEEGHFARECRSSAKARKKYRQLLKSPRSRKEKEYIENGSAPPDMGKAHKRKKIQNDDMIASTSRKSKRRGDRTNEDLEDFPSRYKERGGTTPKKSKRRGDWMFEDPEDYGYASPTPQWKSKRRGGWMTEDPEELYPRKFNNRYMTPHATPPRWKSFTHAGSSGSKGSTNHFHHRSSASRFGSTSANPPPRIWKIKGFDSKRIMASSLSSFAITKTFSKFSSVQQQNGLNPGNQRPNAVLIRCESSEDQLSVGKDEPSKGSKKLQIGSPIIVIEAPKVIKTAASVPCLRANSGLVKPGDVGRIVSRKPKDVWAVRLSIGTYLLDGKYFKPLDLAEFS